MNSHVLPLCLVVFPVKLPGEIRNLITPGREKGHPHSAIRMLTGHPFSSFVVTPIGSRTTGPGSDVQRGRDVLSSGCGAELKSAGHVDFSGGERRSLH